MGKRLNIGVYIGPDDTDVAAWFNLLQTNHMSRAKWVRGLLSAYALEQHLPIGTVNIHAPLAAPQSASTQDTLLFGRGSSQAETIKSDKYGYGWQIRGPNREFIYGSVINVSISKDEILPIVDEVWRNGHQLATFLKALIRKNLVYGNENIPPKLEDLQKIYSEFIVLQNSKSVEPRTPIKKRARKPVRPSKEAPVKSTPESPETEVIPAAAKEPASQSHPAGPAKTFNFQASGDNEVPEVSSVPQRKNPLLDEI